MKLLDGKKISEEIKKELKKELEELYIKIGEKPGLAVLIIGEDKASKIYVKGKIKACEEIGINSFHYEFPETVSEKELIASLDILNKKKEIHGILVQLPLPQHINEENIINRINPKKDIDCFTPENIGRVFINEKNIVKSCTPSGIIELLHRNKVAFQGKKVVILGRSNIVGKPLALMMINEGATVTVCNSKTKDLDDITKMADILIVAIGKDRFVKKEMIKKDVIIVDVGINRVDGRIYGDVDFEDVLSKVSLITPVPGGVGPMTIAMLLKNNVELFKKIYKDGCDEN
ncbi:MAG: bifunctional methylenetetrahydrofolate dehydrogenase/methenyltetrahydrofolate cyclohydrolase FolD [Fusobacteriaceae bacterium]